MPGLIPQKAATAIAAVIVAVWALAQLAAVFVPNYTVPDGIHLALMLVLGVVFGIKERGGGSDPAPPPPPPAPAPAPEPAPEPLRPGAVSATELIERLRREQGRP